VISFFFTKTTRVTHQHYTTQVLVIWSTRIFLDERCIFWTASTSFFGPTDVAGPVKSVAAICALMSTRPKGRPVTSRAVDFGRSVHVHL
jgi:hypothetical protein